MMSLLYSIRSYTYVVVTNLEMSLEISSIDLLGVPAGSSVRARYVVSGAGRFSLASNSLNLIHCHPTIHCKSRVKFNQ